MQGQRQLTTNSLKELWKSDKYLDLRKELVSAGEYRVFEDKKVWLTTSKEQRQKIEVEVFEDLSKLDKTELSLIQKYRGSEDCAKMVWVQLIKGFKIWDAEKRPTDEALKLISRMMANEWKGGSLPDVQLMVKMGCLGMLGDIYGSITPDLILKEGGWIDVYLQKRSAHQPIKAKAKEIEILPVDPKIKEKLDVAFSAVENIKEKKVKFRDLQAFVDANPEKLEELEAKRKEWSKDYDVNGVLDFDREAYLIYREVQFINKINNLK